MRTYRIEATADIDAESDEDVQRKLNELAALLSNTEAYNWALTSELVEDDDPDCDECNGSGEVRWNDNKYGDPQYEMQTECLKCQGSGVEPT